MRYRKHGKPYHPSQITCFGQRISPERLEGLMENIVEKLRNAGGRGEIVACDATFIKAYSKRDPKDDSLKAIAILTPGLGGLRRVIGSATSST
jgi:hypothetical protein